MTYAHAAPARSSSAAMGRRRKRRTKLLHRGSLDNCHLCGRFSFLTIRERILKGDTCDVFASSSPAVIEDLMKETLVASGQTVASWYVVFSANEMVVVVENGNALGIHHVEDLAKPNVKFVRVTGAKDLATDRTIEFLNRASTLEGKPELAQTLISNSIFDPSKPTSVSDVVHAVREGRANAGVVYYSAAVAAEGLVGIIRFPASTNMSEAIRNAASVPSCLLYTSDAA